MNQRIPTMAATALLLAAAVVPADQRPAPPPRRGGDASECTQLDIQLERIGNSYVIRAHVKEECKGSLFAYAWIEVDGEATSLGSAEGMTEFAVESSYISSGAAFEACARLEGDLRYHKKTFPVSLEQCVQVPAQPQTRELEPQVEWSG